MALHAEYPRQSLPPPPQLLPLQLELLLSQELEPLLPPSSPPVLRVVHDEPLVPESELQLLGWSDSPEPELALPPDVSALPADTTLAYCTAQ